MRRPFRFSRPRRPPSLVFSAGRRCSASTRTGSGSARSAISRCSRPSFEAKRRSSRSSSSSPVIWLVFNLRLGLGSVGEGRPIFTTQQGMEVALPGRQQLRTIASAIAMVLSGLIALYASSQWETWVTWQKAVSLASWIRSWARRVLYVFTMPFLQFVRGIAQTLIVMAALAPARSPDFRALTSGFSALLSMTPAVRRHIGSLIAVFFLLLAAGAWLGRLICRASGRRHLTASRAGCTAGFRCALALPVVRCRGRPRPAARSRGATGRSRSRSR